MTVQLQINRKQFYFVYICLACVRGLLYKHSTRGTTNTCKINLHLGKLLRFNIFSSDTFLNILIKSYWSQSVTRCPRGDVRSFFCTYKTYLYAQNEISYEYIQILF